MDNTTPNQPQYPQNPSQNPSQNPQYPPQYPPQYQTPAPGYDQQPSSNQSASRTAFVARLNAFRRRRPVLAGIAALIAICIVCGACTGIIQGISGAGQTAGSPGQTSNVANATSATATKAEPTATAIPTATPKPKSWTTIKSFTGTATTSTDTFAIPDGAHIVWSCKKSDSFGGNFAVELYQDDGTLVDLVANTQDNDSGTYTLHADGFSDGKYYLKVDTYSENWTINVQVYE